MRKLSRRFGLAIVVFVVLISGRSERAMAGLITYTESAVVVGSLGTDDFDSLVTFTLTADTSGITQSGAYHDSSEVTSATVTVDGMTATLTDEVYVFAGKNFAGFTDVPSISMSGMTLLDVFNPQFNTYNLSTPLGPVAGLSGGGAAGPIATTLGTLSLNVYSGNGTFTASAAAVPEPSSLVLCGLAATIGLVSSRLRRDQSLA